MKKIGDMEQNPWVYQHLLGHFTYDAEQVYVLRRIDVHESIPPLDPMIPHIFETMFSYYELEISKGKELITTIKKSFEEFFEQDQNVYDLYLVRYTKLGEAMPDKTRDEWIQRLKQFKEQK